MKNMELDTLIKILTIELSHVDKSDPDNLKMIKNLEHSLEKLLQNEDTEKQAPQTVSSDNRSFLETAVHFEESHPKLASTLNDISNILAGIGL